MNIFIIGAKSSFIFEVIEACELAGYKEIVCVDNLGQPKQKTIDGYPIVSLDDVKRLGRIRTFIIPVHTPSFRKNIARDAQIRRLEPVSVIHTSSTISTRAKISSSGVFIAARTVIGTHSSVGDFVVINRGALIGHDVLIEKFVTIESGAIVNGFCRIEEGAYIASGAIILPKIKIGKNSVVAGGAVVREDVAANTLVAGIPATVKKTGIAGYIGE